jgi:antitoxin ParD1/3/4
MTTMNISLPDSLKDYVDEQVGGGGYGTSSEHVRELIRKDQDRKRLRAITLQGATSGLTAPVDADYSESLRTRARFSQMTAKPAISDSAGWAGRRGRCEVVPRGPRFEQAYERVGKHPNIGCPLRVRTGYSRPAVTAA